MDSKSVAFKSSTRRRRGVVFMGRPPQGFRVSLVWLLNPWWQGLKVSSLQLRGPRCPALAAPPDWTVGWGWRITHTSRPVPTPQSQPRNLRRSYCGQAFIHGMFAGSNHFDTFSHVKGTLPSLLIFKILSHPVSPSKLKDLEDNFRISLWHISACCTSDRIGSPR